MNDLGYLLLRAVPVLLRVLLAVVLSWFLIREGRRLGRDAARSWALILFPVAVAAALAVYVEGAREALGSRRPVLYRDTYHAAYLLNGALAAMLPAGLLAINLRSPRARWTAVAVLYVAVALVVVAALRGVHADWNVLLSMARPLEFIALAGWVTFFALYFLSHLPGVGGHMAAFLGVAAVYVMLTPINEVVIQLVGREDAAAVWNPMLIMQTVRYGLQVWIVWLLLRALRKVPGLQKSADSGTHAIPV